MLLTLKRQSIWPRFKRAKQGSLNTCDDKHFLWLNSCNPFDYEAERAEFLSWRPLLSLSNEVAASYNVTSQLGSLQLLCQKFERTIDVGHAKPPLFIQVNAVISSASSPPNQQRDLGARYHSHSDVREIFTVIWRTTNLLSHRGSRLKMLATERLRAPKMIKRERSVPSSKTSATWTLINGTIST